MSLIRLGASGAIEQPKRYEGGPNKPLSTIRSFRGPKAAIIAMIQQAGAEGCDFTVEEIGPDAVITMTFSNADPNEQPKDTWELIPSMVEKDILDADVAIVSGLTDRERSTIRKFIQNPPENQDPALDPNGNAMIIYNLMQGGLRSVRVYAPVLRRTRTAPNSYAVAQSLLHVGRILSNATVADEGVPSNFLVPFNGPPFNLVSTKPFFTYGWLKLPPTLQQVAGSRTQIAQEWEFGLWSTDIYLAKI